MLKTPDIQNDVQQHMIEVYGENIFMMLFIGGYKNESIWQWEDGSAVPLDQEKWMRSGASDHDILLITSWRSKKLSDMLWISREHDFENKGFICEKQGEIVSIFLYQLS